MSANCWFRLLQSFYIALQIEKRTNIETAPAGSSKASSQHENTARYLFSYFAQLKKITELLLRRIRDFGRMVKLNIEL